MITPQQFFRIKSPLTILIGVVLILIPVHFVSFLGGDISPVGVLFVRLLGIVFVVFGWSLWILNADSLPSFREAIAFAAGDFCAATLILLAVAASVLGRSAYLLALIYAISAVGYIYCSIHVAAKKT